MLSLLNLHKLMPAGRYHCSMRLCVNKISQLHLFQTEFIDVILATAKSRLVLEKKILDRMCGPETNATNKPSQQVSNKGNWFYLNFISYFVSAEMLKGKGKS